MDTIQKTLGTILVVEDNENHIAEAKKVLGDLGYKVYVAKTLVRAWEIVSEMSEGIDGVISDIFYPYSLETYREQPERTYADPETPCGIGMAMIAAKWGKPVVLCTDQHHHGNKVEWIVQSIGRMGDIEIITMTDWDEGKNVFTDALGSKNWAYAVERLEKKAQRIKDSWDK